MDRGDQNVVISDWIKELIKYFCANLQDWTTLTVEMEKVRFEAMKQQLVNRSEDEFMKMRQEFDEKFQAVLESIARIEESKNQPEPATTKSNQSMSYVVNPRQKSNSTSSNHASTSKSITDFGMKSKRDQAKNSTFASNTKTHQDETQESNIKIATWNVAGLPDLNKINSEFIKMENPEIIICFNGTHCSADGVHKEYDREGYENAYWNLGKTFAGVKILSKIKAIGVKTDLPDSNLSDEKRTIAIEFQKFYIISIYIVNAGRGLPNLPKRLAFNDAFYAYVRKLDKKKPVIIAGNMNISQKEVENHIGFTQEGRDKFTNSLSFGFMNDFRKLYPDQASAFTFWSYLGGAPSRNVGWRLDYFMVSQRFMKHVKDSVIRSEVLGSDHCPIILMLKT